MKKYIIFLFMTLINFGYSLDFFNFEKKDPNIINIAKANSREIRLDNVCTYQWNGLIWVNLFKEEVSYNSNGLIDEIILYQYSNNHWFKYYKQCINYDSNNEIDEIYTFYWDSGVWNEEYLFLYDYEESNLVFNKRAIWDQYYQVYLDEFQQMFIYENGDLLLILSESFDGVDWNNQSKTVMIYENNLRIEELSYAWVVNDWVEDNRVLNFYQDSSYPTESIYQYKYLDEWINSSKQIFSYYPSNEIETQVGYIWENDWIENSKVSYNYDENENLSEVIQESWDDDDWIPSYLSEYNYIEVLIDNNTIEHDDYISIFPNPVRANNLIKFNIKNLKITQTSIYNSKGQKIKDIKVIGNKCYWNLRDQNNNRASSGIYFTIFTDNGKIKARKKIILMK